MQSTEKQIEKAYLVGVVFSNKDDALYSLTELKNLCETAGLNVVGKNWQYVNNWLF